MHEAQGSTPQSCNSKRNSFSAAKDNWIFVEYEEQENGCIVFKGQERNLSLTYLAGEQTKVAFWRALCPWAFGNQDK
jgi:hypothetical protein